jgi:6-phosphogluconolactonase/glucosamine-6-phosphate isomerase/deaminase
MRMTSSQTAQGKASGKASGAKISIHQEADAEKAAQQAGAALTKLLERFQETPVLLLLAGGSARAVLAHIDEAVLGQHLTVTVTDDRFSEELDINNFTQLQADPFYNKLVNTDSFAISTEVWPGDTHEMQRQRFEKGLRDWRKDFPYGTVIALLGVGADGHIAGIIPGALTGDDFVRTFDSTADVALLDAGDRNEFPLRTTVTFPFLRTVDFAFVYAAGESKKPVLERMVAGNSTQRQLLEAFPAGIVNEMQHVEVFTDQKISHA